MSTQTPSTWRERLASPLTWHYAGVALLSVLVGVLGVRLAMDWVATNSNSTDALIGKQIELKTLQVQTAPLRGLDQRVADSRKQMKEFFDNRIPANYSSIAEEVGNLEVKSGVRLSRMLYTQGPASGELTEISLDAGISGEYTQIMRFINGLERDKTFFVIRSMALTGQQGGMVNLRLRVSTWMRPSDVPAGLPQTPAETPSGVAPVKEGM
jgi:type IV pilus assembly protein PilO